MDVELEGAVQDLTGGIPVDEPNAWKWAAGIFGTIAVGAFGWVVKRQRSGQVLEDTENETKTDLIQRLQKRNRELEEQLGEAMLKQMAGYDDIGQAKRLANQANIEADTARAASERAQAAAAHAQELVHQVGDISAKRLAYIHTLRSAMSAAGIAIPDWPEGVL